MPAYRDSREARLHLLMGQAQALGQQKLQPVAEPLGPVAQARALMRELVLEELFPGEELE